MKIKNIKTVTVQLAKSGRLQPGETATLSAEEAALPHTGRLLKYGCIEEVKNTSKNKDSQAIEVAVEVDAEEVAEVVKAAAKKRGRPPKPKTNPDA